MLPHVLPGSKITLDCNDAGEPTVTLPRRWAAVRYFRAGVPVAVLCVLAQFWAEIAARISDDSEPDSPVFLGAVLVFCTLGCAAFGWLLFLFVRPPISERILIRDSIWRHDSGIDSVISSINSFLRPEMHRQVPAARRHRIYADREQRTLTLRDGFERCRLTIDQGIARIEIGRSLTDVEREWLYQLLAGPRDDRRAAS